jgi:membrane protease YdiL (CAAX protease family)
LSILTVLGALWLAGRLLDRRKFVDFGFHLSRGWWADFGFGIALGGVLMGLVFLVELAAGWIRIEGFLRGGGDAFWLALANALFFFIGVGVREEIIFRCYPLRLMAEGLNLPSIGPRNSLLIALLVTSFFFGLAHLANPNATWISTFNIMLAGLLLGAGLVLNGEMAIPIGLHIGWNFFQGNVFGFAVSGTRAGATLIGIRQGGPDLVTGGAFGPEAGVVGLAAMALGLGLTVWWIRRRTGQVRLQVELAQYHPPSRIGDASQNPERV